MGVRGALTAAVATATVAAGTLSGCGGDAGEQNKGPGKLTVWLMTGSAPAALITELNKEFTDKHPGVAVDFQVQQWDGIQDKLTTALASNDPPDIVELGNTQAPKFVTAGALADLTADREALGGAHWLQGLAATGEKGGKTYATPFYAANRIVVYRKDLFRKAGIKETPRSLDELLTAGEKLQAENGGKDFQALYLPGQSWYTLLSLVWARGGDVARESGGTWKGTLDSPEAQEGFRDYARLYEKLSKGPVDQDEANPQQATVFAKGRVGMFVGLPWEIATATAAKGGDPKLADKIGAFPIPGPDGKPAPVFLGGSNLAVAAGSDAAKEAKDWLALILSEKYQTKLAAGGVVPALTNLGDSVFGDNQAATVMAEAAATGGRVTPPVPAWAAVEAGTNPIKDALTKVLRGTEVTKASKQASDAITAKLAGR
ncbi:sugar ABC transporter substrate-binding protein [Pilimelia anulata]|uniref:Sugar ABC transporter substrate-binding protein n=1 Tax=Pilimelia anulata TaxID=53371 RepID=A0A8J3B491_9ACTN|nr:sugar ABC transporter substrate-binding protein [Pilimelia anulata]GGJ94626.1 sugar ABC transporter substrate-binding protein [Pilimelia anulata]